MLKEILFMMALFTNLSLFAEPTQGEVLEKQIWESIKNHKWSDLDKKIAPYFQAALFDGPRNKEQYMTHAKELNISDYTLNNFVVTDGPGIKVITYNVVVSETIENKRITSNAVRLSVWQENNGNWLWTAHAILIPVPSSE
jgi:hypothetical protein